MSLPSDRRRGPSSARHLVEGSVTTTTTTPLTPQELRPTSLQPLPIHLLKFVYGRQPFLIEQCLTSYPEWVKVARNLSNDETRKSCLRPLFAPKIPVIVVFTGFNLLNIAEMSRIVKEEREQKA